MGNAHLVLGQKGEQHAEKFLLKNGYTLETRNFTTPFAEIDIIARHQGFLCFIEVKTRTSHRRGLPREAVTIAKQRKIIAAANAYLKKFGLTGERIRFDVLEVFAQSQGRSSTQDFACTLIPGAFQTDEP